MFEFFNNILGYIELLWSWFAGSIHAMVTLFGMLLSYLVPMTWLPGFLPAIIGSGMIIVIAVSVVKAIFGR